MFAVGDKSLPHWLIDVKLSCVVPYQDTGNERYAALSYVWGDTPRGRQLELVGRNKSELQQEGSLLEESLRIPPTILTAMMVAAKLEYRYLWVDRLCIIQDEAETKHSQIYHMAGIYSNADLTIVATDAAQFPLWGVRPAESDKNGHLANGVMPIIQIGSWKLSEILSNSLWNTRAWTFQELLFSRRAIIFFKNALYCSCHCEEIEYTMLSHLNYSQPSSLDMIRPLLGPYRLHEWPDMDTYTAMVRNYVRRKVSVDMDFSHAFAGLSTTISRAFWGIHYGLPEVFFDACLLWFPACKSNPRFIGRFPVPMDRRKSTKMARSEKTEVDFQERINPLPSWSWMGWAGQFDFWYWHTVNPLFVLTQQEKDGTNDTIMVTKPSAVMASKPIIDWYIDLTHASGPRATVGKNRRIRSNMVPYTISPPQNPTGPGQLWKEVIVNGEEGGFVHASNESVIFRWPIPLAADLPPTPPPHVHSTSPILKFKTRRAWFRLEDRNDPYLCIPEDNWTVPLAVGYLWLHDKDYVEDAEGLHAWANVIAVSEGEMARDELNEKTFWARQPSEQASGLVDRLLPSWITAAWRRGDDNDGCPGRHVSPGRSPTRNRAPQSSLFLRGMLEEDILADPLKFYNVLCVKERHDDICERVGIGTVLKSAFNAMAAEQEVDFMLG